MPRSDWTDLPEDITAVIERRTGPITGVRSAPTGNHADIAATVHTADGTVFVKAARKLDADRDGPEVRSLRRESLIAPYVTHLAPRLLWQAETGDWLAAGFAHVPGRTATYAPGSPDLDALAKIIDQLHAIPCPGVVDLQVEQRWAHLADDVTPMAGNTLLHTDLNANNLIISHDGNVRAVDWALASKGAAWVEVGQLMPWLILAGHTPQQADAWAARIPSWRQAEPDAIDLYSRLAVEFWQRRSTNRPEPWMPPYLTAWQQWTAYRTGSALPTRTRPGKASNL